MSTNLHDVTTTEQFKELLSADLNRVSLLNFWAPWADPCAQMNQVVAELANKHTALLVLQVEAEQHSEISESFIVESVPSFVILRGHTLLGRIEGADAGALVAAVSKHVTPLGIPTPHSTTSAAPAAPVSDAEKQEKLNKRLKELMAQQKVMLFMKGSPDAPRCGFSRKIVALLRDQGVNEFGSFDILTDDDVRSGLKVLNQWPTFPQLTVNGEFVGGLDVVTDMVESGEFAEVVKV